jgi:ATP-dependent exoDNAse (exonuclease V) beta subunit
LSLVQNVLDQDFKFAGKEIDAAFQKTIQALIRQAGAHALLNLRARNRATWKLLKDCTQLYEKLLLEWHILGFSDVKQALSKSALLGNLEPLYYRLDLKLRHLLLDEFQDTAPAEWRIIEPVVAEILSKYSAEHSFFCVGDVKQAIYGWRGGVAEIFDSLEQKWPQIAVETREKTYRCSQPIIEAVNTIFGGLALNQALAEYPEAVKAWSAWFRPHTTNRVKDPAFVSVNVAAAEDLLAQSAQRIKVLLEQNPKLSVGVLVRRRESIPLVIAELTKIGVPASAEGASTLAESQAVQLILAIFRLMDHPADTISAYHLAVSALGPQMGLQAGPGWGDAASLQMLALKLRESVTLLGVGNFVEDWVLKLKACVSPAEWQRLEQLVALGFAFEQRLSSAFRRGVEFIDFVESTQLEAPLSVAVRVMTMHGSKGLEFDAVILPELDQDLFNLSLVEVLRYYEDRLKAPKLISLKPQKAVCQLDERLKSAQEQVATSVVKESLSLLYVALTRARRGLYLFCKQQAPSRKKEYAATFSGVVLAALKLDAESCGELYTQGHKDWANEVQDKGTAAPACGAAAQTLTKLSLKSSAGALRGLVRESPSKLYNAETKLGEVLILPGAGQGRELGILLHALFQKVEWLGDGALSDELLLGWLKGRPYGEKLKLRAISEFRQYIAQTEISSLLKPERYRPFGVAELKVKCELSFALRQQNSILSGYMDRVVLCGEGKGLKAAEIFDFKTDRLSSEKAFQDEKLERYKQQLGIYRQAASRLFGLDLKAIRCQLVFLSLGQIVEVPL